MGQKVKRATRVKWEPEDPPELQETLQVSSLNLVNLGNLERKERREIKEFQEKWVKEGYLENKVLRVSLVHRDQKVTLD